VNTFTEDVTGTTDLSTGRRHHPACARTRTPSPVAISSSPCPVCGGFCSGPGGQTDIGVRTLCDGNEDCGAGSHCVLEPLCSFGLDIDKPCRPFTPAGGPTEFFGNPSADCRMSRSALLGSINIFFNPTTTAFTSLTASVDCKSPGFTGSSAKRAKADRTRAASARSIPSVRLAPASSSASVRTRRTTTRSGQTAATPRASAVRTTRLHARTIRNARRRASATPQIAA
jgi:hypothetical protein